jgi:hypothetical protein
MMDMAQLNAETRAQAGKEIRPQLVGLPVELICHQFTAVGILELPDIVQGEQQVMAALAKLAEQRTLLLISHREETVRWADRVVRLAAGRGGPIGNRRFDAGTVSGACTHRTPIARIPRSFDRQFDQTQRFRGR